MPSSLRSFLRRYRKRASTPTTRAAKIFWRLTSSHHLGRLWGYAATSPSAFASLSRSSSIQMSWKGGVSGRIIPTSESAPFQCYERIESLCCTMLEGGEAGVTKEYCAKIWSLSPRPQDSTNEANLESRIEYIVDQGSVYIARYAQSSQCRYSGQHRLLLAKVPTINTFSAPCSRHGNPPTDHAPQEHAAHYGSPSAPTALPSRAIDAPRSRTATGTTSPAITRAQASISAVPAQPGL